MKAHEKRLRKAVKDDEKRERVLSWVGADDLKRLLDDVEQMREEREVFRVAILELLKANCFGMSVTGGWDDAHKDPLYLQCVEADRLGTAALKRKPR